MSPLVTEQHPAAAGRPTARRLHVSTEVAGRVRAAVARSRLTNRDFAQLIGTSASRLSTYLNGKVTPSAAMLVRIERAGYRTESSEIR